MLKGRRIRCLLAAVILGVSMPAGCGSQTGHKGKDQAYFDQKERGQGISKMLSYTESMDLQFACRFAVDYYEDGYALILTENGKRYLVVPEDGEAPEDLDQEITVLRRPLNNIYLVATAAMDMFCQLDGLDFVGFSGQKSDGWAMEEVRQEMEKGNILYAGKYDSPDYERIVSGGCSLAVENNMITHCPEVAEKLESFGIPVLIDSSSYESHPLGRVEWIKLYGVLLGRQEAASAAFDRQVKAFKRVADMEASGKTAAFFYITANGMVSVRTASDYVPALIRLAGGRYVPDVDEKESRRSTMVMQMEEFYLAAKDADYLVYNSTIDGELESIEELIMKENLLGDFKAVQEGNVWCTDRDLYQQSMSAGLMMEDIHRMLSGDADRQKEIQCLYQLK